MQAAIHTDVVESVNKIHKQTNRILSRKEIAHSVALHIAVACFVTDWSLYEVLRVCDSIVGSTTYQYGFANHNVVNVTDLLHF